MPDLLAGSIIYALDTPPTVDASSTADEAGFSNVSPSYSGGSTSVGVTFIAPTTGRVRIDWNARAESNTAGVRAYVSVAVRTGATIGSGAVVAAASDDEAIETPEDASGGGRQRLGTGRSRMVSGLTPGDSYNARVEHAVSGTGNGDVFYRSIIVAPAT